MHRFNLQRYARLLTPAEGFLHLATLPLCLVLFFQQTLILLKALGLSLSAADMEEMESQAAPGTGVRMSSLLFLVLVALRLIAVYRNRNLGKAECAVGLVRTFILFIGVVLPLVMGFTAKMTSALAVLYAVSMILGRVWTILQNRRRTRIVVRNVLASLVLLLSAWHFMLSTILIASLAIVFLMKIAFGRIRLETLREILRKTFAAEIMFGLLLLVFTFSFIMYQVEPGIKNMGDALWYCFATVTTIGFGDFTAQTAFGRVLTVILGAYGIVVTALITSIIVNYYGEMKVEGNASAAGAGGETESGKGGRTHETLIPQSQSAPDEAPQDHL